jgi:hypothetical protein
MGLGPQQDELTMARCCEALWRGQRVISFHSVPILLSHCLNDGRSILSNGGHPEIGCDDSHGCFVVSGIISRILALLKTIVG